MHPIHSFGILGMAGAGSARLAKKVFNYMRKFDPDVTLTFEKDGLCAICRSEIGGHMCLCAFPDFCDPCNEKFGNVKHQMHLYVNGRVSLLDDIPASDSESSSSEED